MKHLWTFILIIFLLAPSIAKFSVVVWWNSNLEQIIKTECVNRFNRKSLCNGHCILADRLSKINGERQKNQAVASNILSHDFETYFFKINKKLQPLTSQINFRKNSNFNYLIRNDRGHTLSPFVPPSLV